MKNEGHKKQPRKKQSRGGHPCIVCGRKIGVKVKLPAGNIYICTDLDCKDELLLKMNDNALPIAQFDMQALIDHEVISEEIVKHFAKDFATIKRLAIDVEEYIWSGETLGEMFHEALVEAGQALEKKYVAGIPNKNLPLHSISEFKSSEAKSLFECRLKKEY